MGVEVEGTCLECGETFSVSHGGGFFFHLVRCEACGSTKSITFEELGLVHLRYLKGLTVPYAVVSMPLDTFVQEELPIEPLSGEDYRRAIDALAGDCSCRGKFTLGAPPRCPACRSTHIDEGEITIFYD